MESFPICAEVLRGVSYKTSDLDRLIKEALLSDVPLSFADMTTEEDPPPFPFDTALPVAASLSHPLGHGSGAALLETPGTAMYIQEFGWAFERVRCWLQVSPGGPGAAGRSGRRPSPGQAAGAAGGLPFESLSLKGEDQGVFFLQGLLQDL
jgi:hypothetical protein